MPQATATINGVEVARTSTWEFPPTSITQSHFTPTATSTHCPYKGDAKYYTLTTNKTELEDAAWYYPEPLPAMERIRGFVAFYKKAGVEVRVEE
ncbi:hypothetical protein ST47_g5539 [Ascochyta rabiei]|uniref:DUF427 domain-containing protein n=1 Tax=Didymella rabiei TaxID=5454 RepID=A0A163DSK5_DIDRA|nr:hypothetical protein ST47_g5539 [Ascochyta rabiei]